MIAEKFRLDLHHGKFVELDYEAIDRICDLIRMGKAFKTYKPYPWNDTRYWPDESEEKRTVSQYFAVGNAINFGYWQRQRRTDIMHCRGTKGGIQTSGALYLWRALRTCYENNTFPILDSQKLAKISVRDLKRIFSTDTGRTPLPQLEERTRNWQDLGSRLCEYWKGEFYNLLQDCSNSLYTFVQYSRQFRAYDDPLCKLTMVNAILHQGRGLVKFQEPILPGVDYQLTKQQLRIGILKPKKAMAKKLVKEELLSEEEARELRNACLSAFIHMMNKTGVAGDYLDNRWWFNRANCNDDNPVCRDPKTSDKCLFIKVCKRYTYYKRPLEHTRYY